MSKKWIVLYAVLVLTYTVWVTGQPGVGATTVIKDNQMASKSSTVRQKLVVLTFNGNSTFVLPDTPLANTVPEFTRNGLVQTPPFDYTISGATITLTAPNLWAADDVISCRYSY